ncbi:MAG: hypothetical protein WD431_19320 [Cyclobacteriaceae bacterium]
MKRVVNECETWYAQLPAYLAQMPSRTFAVLHFRYRSFITTMSKSAPYASPNHGCRFPLSIWPDGIEFTCSLKWHVLRFP